MVCSKNITAILSQLQQSQIQNPYWATDRVTWKQGQCF